MITYAELQARQQRKRESRIEAIVFTLITVVLIGGAIASFPAQVERDKGRSQYRQCLQSLDTVETRCNAVGPNQCTLTAAEFERYQIQRLNQKRICSQ